MIGRRSGPAPAAAIGTPLLMVLAACAGGGSALVTASPAPSPAPSPTQASPATSAPTVVPTATPPSSPTPRPLPAIIGTVTFDLGRGVGDQDQADVREGVARMSTYLSEVLGGARAEPVTAQVIASRVGGSRPPWAPGLGSCCAANGAAFFVDVDDPSWSRIPPFSQQARVAHLRLVGHEYVHVWQNGLGGQDGCTSAATPPWIREGMAEYLVFQALVRDQLVRLADVTTFKVSAAKSVGLPSLGTLEQSYSSSGAETQIGYLAVERLTAKAGLASLKTFCVVVGSGEPWSAAFQRAFGMTRDSFYGDFDPYLATLR